MKWRQLQAHLLLFYILNMKLNFFLILYEIIIQFETIIMLQD